MLDSVLSALQSGDYAAAETAARTWLATRPDDAQAEHLLGVSLQGRDDLDGADAAFARALALAPERADTHVARALLAARRRDTGTARASLERVVAHDPNQLAAYLSLAQLALARGDSDEAERQLRIADRINPDHPHLLALHGQVLLARGKNEAALAMLSRAAATSPEDGLVQGVLGLVLLALGRHAFAEQALRNALALQPDATALRHALLHALLAQKQDDEAAIEVGVLLRASPSDAAALALQGQLAQARGEFDVAREAYERSLLSRPHPGVLVSLHAVFQRGGDAAQFDALLERLVAAHPHFDAAWSALIGRARGDALRSATLAERWYTASASVPATELLAQVSEARGELAHAAELARQVVARDPLRPASQIVLARAELRAGNAQAAVTRLQPVAANTDTPVELRAVLGWLGHGFDGCGQPVPAAAAWRSGQSLTPDPLPLPVLDAAPAVVDAALRRAARSDATHVSETPTLLWAPPGSRPDLAAVLLGGIVDLRLAADRYGAMPRQDQFAQPDTIDLTPATLDTAAAAFVDAWRNALSQRGHDPSRTLDWLPHLDRRTLPLLRVGAPSTRIVAVLRDPRDLLLNWIAFGSAQQYTNGDAVIAAQWLAQALDTLVRLRDEVLLPTLILRDGIASGELAGAAQAVADFLGLDVAPDHTAAQRLRNGPLALPTAFPDGHWRTYREAMADAFAPLHAVAVQLGYPRD